MTESTKDEWLKRVLETIDKRLTGIEDKLENVIRLEEKVTNHEQVLSRYGHRLDEGDVRLRKVELWQAGHDPDLLMNSIKSNHDNIEIVKKEVDTLKGVTNINRGQKDIVKEGLKWLAGILAAIIIYQATRGS